MQGLQTQTVLSQYALQSRQRKIQGSDVYLSTCNDCINFAKEDSVFEIEFASILLSETL